ncbi:hypothetical protein Q7P35_008296 [Cladosporium inversicolor]
MPRGRRPPVLHAAGSLSARLPIGTPSFIRDTGPPSHSHQQEHQPHAAAASAFTNKHTKWTLDGCHDPSDSDTTTSRLGSGNSSHLNLVMASTHSSDPVSIAAAKLERQNKRIEATNAALLAQVPSEKHKQQPRSKGKAWKPFDFATEPNDATHAQQQHIDAPAVETRVNVFRVPSQGNLLSRPISRISSHTHDSSYTESERRDSSFLESDDFQVFTGRKKSRPTIPTFNDKPNVQNPTVEATFSKRDITDVFGNELPVPGFMDGNPGTLDGQLQFIQHPNGDVSAHQWSASRFGWENIGQFSNIRKKIEGQLAADRLKGETAWQSLQQNTLAYFRTVAKQREADAMGLPFTLKDIAACLPDTRPPSTAPTGPRRITSKVEMPERPNTMMPRQESLSPEKIVGVFRGPAAMPPRPNFDPLPRSQAATQHLDARLNPARHFTPTPCGNTKDDPFVSDSTTQQPYGYPYANSMHDPHMDNWSAYQSWNHPMNPMNMYYPGYAMPHMGYQYHGHIPHAPRPLYEPSHAYDQTTRWRAGGLLSQQQQPSTQQTQQHMPPHQTDRPVFAHESSVRPAAHYDSSPDRSKQAAITSAQPASSATSKPASPFDTRSAMREHVMKMGEQAKERTKSQANIGRTVLYDPFQDVQKKDPTPEPVKQESPPKPAPEKENLEPFPLLGLGLIPGLNGLSGHGQDPFPTTLAPSIQMPFDATPFNATPINAAPVNATSALSENDLRDSSPDREWQRETAEQEGEQDMPLPQPSYLKQWNTTQLDEWLWSGNKFSRQEDFHQRIMATDAILNRRKHSSTIARPIAPPSSRFGTAPTIPQPSTTTPPSTSDSNILTNRLLVPVLENLASYVQGPIEKRRDYFCQWVKAPEWAIDRSATGNESFFDSQWGQPPERLGRDPRYQPVPRDMDVRFGNFDVQRGSQAVAMPGYERRFGYGGRF